MKGALLTLRQQCGSGSARKNTALQVRRAGGWGRQGRAGPRSVKQTRLLPRSVLPGKVFVRLLQGHLQLCKLLLEGVELHADVLALLFRHLPQKTESARWNQQPQSQRPAQGSASASFGGVLARSSFDFSRVCSTSPSCCDSCCF